MKGKTMKKLPLKNQAQAGLAPAAESPRLIREDSDSIALTGTTAASDVNYYFDEVKQENNENPGNKTRDHNVQDFLNNYKG